MIEGLSLEQVVERVRDGQITADDCRAHIKQILDNQDLRPGIRSSILFYFECAVTASRCDARRAFISSIAEHCDGLQCVDMLATALKGSAH